MTDGDPSSIAPVPLKRDVRSRVRSTPAQRQAALQAYARSGLSGPQFARSAGIKYQTLVTWRRQAKASAPASALIPSISNVAFLEAVPITPPASACLDLLLPGNVHLHLSCPSQMPLAAALLQQLDLKRSPDHHSC